MNESPRLTELKALYPELFKPISWIEDGDFLKPCGITIPGKNAFPVGYLKHFPQDFIVEEIGEDGTVATIDPEPDAQKKGMALPERAPTYYVTLVKCSLTTFDAVRIIAEGLGVAPSAIQYAGLKDQRAITAQRLSIRGTSRDKLLSIQNPHFFLKDITPGKGVLVVGALTGNRFKILMRTNETIKDEATIAALIKGCERVKERGFYSFFYLQRFSHPRFINYKWGRDILRGDYESAVRSVLTEPSPTEILFFQEMRKSLAEAYGDWVRMQAMLGEGIPESFVHESKMLAHLVAHPSDFLGALCAVEEQASLWVNAYMSLLFNQLLSDLIIDNRQIPNVLPFPLSHDRSDTGLYRKYFERDRAFPPQWKNLRAFPKLRTAHRDLIARSTVTVHDVDVVPEGIMLSFSLLKGQYATTFLSHLFNLVNSVTDGMRGTFSLADVSSVPPGTREYFKEILVSQSSPTVE